MEKKFKISDNPNLAKTIYGIVVAILCVTAIVIGIVAANSRPADPTDNGTLNEEPNEEPNETPNDPPSEENKEPEKVTFISPVSGKIITEHSLTVPVFSVTLEEWRVHAGIDISTADSAPVFAVADGEVTDVYNHPMLGTTVEITHADNVKSIYSNLSADASTLVKKGATVSRGDQIGVVGETSISELAEEPHLHFEMSLNDECVDPLGYISEEAQESSLGIGAGT